MARRVDIAKDLEASKRAVLESAAERAHRRLLMARDLLDGQSDESIARRLNAIIQADQAYARAMEAREILQEAATEETAQ